MKKIIINADDFGLDLKINRAIIKCYQHKIVSRISFISNTDFFLQSIDLLKSSHIEEVGVHLNLAGPGTGRPLSGNLAGAVDKDGLFFLNYTQVIGRLMFKKIKLDEVEKEFRLQIERVLKGGFKISHLDSHQHLHLFPVVSDIVLKLAREYEISYIRCPYSEARNIISIVVNRFSAGLRGKIYNSNLITSDYFKGFDFSGRLDTGKIYNVLDSLKEGITELMVHPGLRDTSVSAGHDIREDEAIALLSPDIQKIYNSIALNN